MPNDASKFTAEEVATLRWAWEITWRQPTAEDEQMREKLRLMIPAKDRPPRENG